MRGEHSASSKTSRPSTGSSPHARGAHWLIPLAVIWGLGSSPHARGARVDRTVRAVTDGLIPACAGSTRTPTPTHSPPPAHPRMRGEHLQALPKGRAVVGSSPHARGARKERGRNDPSPRLIPACAGSTVAEHRLESTWRAHPRMRGEHLTRLDNAFERDGSSPHARGAPVRLSPGTPRPGLIPACAGST